jgi:uncharacterized tellurite resistance protein B-like protein
VSILNWFTAISRTAPDGAGESDTVARIVRELDKLEPDRARFLASFAYVLSRVAGADLHFSDEETRHMVEAIERLGGLPEAQAVLVVEIAKKQNQLFGGTENYLVTRQFRELATDAQRRELLDCLFGVSAADDAISGEEEAQIWQIASELGFSHQEYVQARLAYSDKRTVLRRRS